MISALGGVEHEIVAEDDKNAMETNEIESRNRRQIGIWLLICCALIFAMVVLGGVTRLTGSGLSMVEWEPVYGILPPMSQAEWQEVFDKYKLTPEYQQININMDLQGFKGIFWLEYFHRILGRLIGLVFLVPFLFFWFTRKVERSLVPKLIIMFVLGGLQGLLGWYMVKSGLVDDPHVSQYRLTAHLMLAVVIYGYILWVALGLLSSKAGSGMQKNWSTIRRLTYAITGLVFITMASGAFVAGLKAGMAYNTFPLMEGRWVPEGILAMQPWFMNLFENTATVQFDHRVLAILVFVSILILWIVSRRHELPTRVRIGMHILLFVGVIQVALGISTLLLYVPVHLAAAHQAGALLVFTIALYLAHQLKGFELQSSVSSLRYQA